METATQQIFEQYDKEVVDQTLAGEHPAGLRKAGNREAITFAANAYRREHLLNLTPVQVIKKLYDTAIFACKKKDFSLAHRAITQLILGLNFDYEEMSGGLLRLYMYTKECIRQGNISEATAVLDELRTAWIRAFNL